MSGVKYIKRKATSTDVAFVANNLSDINREEIMADGDNAPQQLMMTFILSRVCMVGLAGDEPICLYGIKKVDDDTCNIWMVGTDKLGDHYREYIRQSKGELKTMSKDFSVVSGKVYDNNIFTKRWLKWMGFEIGEITMMGSKNPLPFRLFKKETI